MVVFNCCWLKWVVILVRVIIWVDLCWWWILLCVVVVVIVFEWLWCICVVVMMFVEMWGLEVVCLFFVFGQIQVNLFLFGVYVQVD